MSDPIVESAKAVQEMAKTTGQAIGAAEKVGGFIAKYIAGSVEQGLGIVEDKLRYMRWERQERMMLRAGELLASLGLQAPSRPVPMKIAIPIFQGASMEEDDSLQDRWAALLVNAANAQSGVEVQPSFTAILGQLSTLDAQILDAVYSVSVEAAQDRGIWTADLPKTARARTQEDDSANSRGEAPVISDEVKLSIGNLVRLGCLKMASTWGGGETFIAANQTVLGAAFVRACRVKSGTAVG